MIGPIILLSLAFGFYVGYSVGYYEGEEAKVEQLNKMLEGLKLTPWEEIGEKKE